MINFTNQPRENNFIEKPISEFLSGINGLKHTSAEFYIHSLMNIAIFIKNIRSSVPTGDLGSYMRYLQSKETAPYFKPNDQMCANLRNTLNSMDFQNTNSGIGHRIANYGNRTGRGRNFNQYCNECKQQILFFLEEVYPAAEQEKFENAAKRMRTQFR